MSNPKFLVLDRQTFSTMKSTFHVWNKGLRSVRQVILNTSFEKSQLKMVETRSLLTFKIPFARICRFLMCIDDVLSLYTRCIHLSCKSFILSFIVQLWNTHTISMLYFILIFFFFFFCKFKDKICSFYFSENLDSLNVSLAAKFHAE